MVFGAASVLARDDDRFVSLSISRARITAGRSARPHERGWLLAQAAVCREDDRRAYCRASGVRMPGSAAAVLGGWGNRRFPLLLPLLGNGERVGERGGRNDIVVRMKSFFRRRAGAAGLVLACVLAVCGPSPASGSVIVPAGVSELAAEARAIVHGRVVRIDTRQGEGRRVERLVTVQVADYLKGGLGNVVQLSLPGGTFGRYRTIMIGAPELAEGDEVVLFLGQGDGEALPHLLGFHQGVYRLVSDPSTGERFVMPPLVQGAAVDAMGQPVAVPVTRGDVTRRPPTLDEFRATIAAALHAAAAPAGAARRRQ